MNLKTVGEKAFEARARKRMTQTQVAETTNVSRHWVSMLKNG